MDGQGSLERTWKIREFENNWLGLGKSGKSQGI